MPKFAAAQAQQGFARLLPIETDFKEFGRQPTNAPNFLQIAWIETPFMHIRTTKYRAALRPTNRPLRGWF